MILRAIRVENWRCFLARVEIRAFAEGLNILHAPNGTGKSTLFEALRRGLLDGHRVTGKDVDAIQPWGRDLTPIVEVEFAFGGTDYRITKRFLGDPLAKLERSEDGRFVPLAEGDAADEKVRKMLTRNPPGRGLARLENWGLAQILWAPQGDPVVKLTGDVLADIRTSLGTQVTGSGADPVESRIRELYLQFFTPGGKLKAGKDAPAVVTLENQLDDALGRRRTALAQQQALEDATREVGDCRARRAQAKYDSEAIGKTLRETEDQAESYRVLLSERERQTEASKAAEAQYKEIWGRIEAIKAVSKELEAEEKLVGSLRADQQPRMQEAQDREREAAEAEVALENVRKRRQAVDDAAGVADAARDFLERSNALADLDKLIGRITSAQAVLDKCKRERTELVAPDDKALRAISKAVGDRREAQQHIDDSLITLEIVSTRDSSISVLAGEQLGPQKLQSGTPVQVKGSPEVVVDLQGLARLRARGPATSIEQYRADLAKADRRLNDLTEAFGTTDAAELETLNEKAKELKRKVDEAQTRLVTLLADRSLEDIRQERSNVQSVVTHRLESYPDWQQVPPDSSALKTRADEVRRSFITAVESAEKEWKRAQEARSEAAKQRDQLGDRLEETRKQVARSQSKLVDLRADGRTDQERDNDLKMVALSWDAAKAKVQDVGEKISKFGDDPATAVSKLEKQLKAADGTATEALGKEKMAEGRLQQLSAQGTYSDLALAEEEVAHLEEELAREKLRVAAIRCLHDTVAQCRSEVLAVLAGPVEAVATTTVQRIAGSRLGRLQLGQSFEPAYVAPPGSGLSVPLDSVSGGEQEQIHFATRLALAEFLAKDERQMVVLDDVLTFTDTGRMARAMTILEEAAQHLQVIVLTCHPERYQALEQAQFIDLESVVRSDLSK